MESLLSVDKEITEIFEGHSNAVYLSIKEISTAVEGRSIPVHQAWAQMTGKSNIYLNSKAMRILTELIMDKANDELRLSQLTKSALDTERRVLIKDGRPLDNYYAKRTKLEQEGLGPKTKSKGHGKSSGKASGRGKD